MLDRRRALATGLMATGATAMLPPTMAKGAGEPLSGSQPPGYYRLRVGGIEAIRVHDGVAVRPLDAGFVRNAELTEVQAALAAVFQPTDEIIIPFTATVVRSPQHTVLIDAGLGDSAPPTAGQCRRNLAAAGIEHEAGDGGIDPGQPNQRRQPVRRYGPDGVNGRALIEQPML